MICRAREYAWSNTARASRTAARFAEATCSKRLDAIPDWAAAMAVAYDARPATRDIDAIRHPSSEVREAAECIAARHDGLGPNWLNDALKGSSRTTTRPPESSTTARLSRSLPPLRSTCWRRNFSPASWLDGHDGTERA
jgi:hypothetical protein